MENSSHWHKPVSDLDSPCGKSRGKQHFHETADDLVNHFESNLDKFLNTEEQDASDVDDDSNAEEEYAEEDYDDLSPYQGEVGQKVLSKSATFPCNATMLSSISSPNEEDDDPETALQQLFSEEPIQRSTSLPQLVSAMKGSREKQGLQPRKLTVNWAPDVYDPPPTSLSHCISRGTKLQKCRKGKSNDEYNNKKKNGKKGQKGNFSRGKEKKQQLRKAAGNDKSHRSLDACPDDGFGIGSPDYCGGSFLKKSVSNMHYSVAEAL
ncbi:uncharacterized protein LOC119995198 isoform X1 [Tripterygium wilfordii]|uniref:uncharacterized protein LOC119995198 isoform X1 n=1 Tax=Tripterygium wilfordii TaxID=458696 RepID=UPI0018F80F4A|nr:uncharacterized protein LOC119995198 isoform X1 [Tripterygium wilfordii]